MFMKKIIFLLITIFFITWCSIDFNDDKDKIIVELNNKIIDLNEKIKIIKEWNDLDFQKLEFEKQKYEENKSLNKENKEIEKIELYKKECLTLKESNSKKYEEFINTCTNKWWNTIDFCINSPAGKSLNDLSNQAYFEKCLDEKKQFNN